MRNESLSETALIYEAIARLRAALPASWQLASRVEASLTVAGRVAHADAILELSDPAGATQQLLLEAKRRVDPIDVERLLDQIKKYGPGPPLLVAPYLSPRTRQLLQELHANYVDLTGNMHLRLERPAVFVQLVGASEDPWHEKRPLDSLKGPAAAQVVRALCDFRPPYGVRELASRAGSSLASTSRVVELLTREAILLKEPRGRITEVDWPKALQRWTENYQVLKSNHAVYALEARGLGALLAKLKTCSLRYAVTGSLAAVQLAPVAPARLGLLLVQDAAAALQMLDLRKTDAGQNVILLEPHDAVAFERARTIEGVLYAAASQVAADLMTSPGRGPEEALALIDWMKEHEGEWRS